MLNNLNKRLSFLVISYGATVSISQIIFLREFLISFSGNELSIGIILANWLILGALGSIFGAFLVRYAKNKALLLSICQICLIIYLFLSIPAIRLIKNFAGFNIGEILPFGVIIISSLLILAPFCILIGFMFVLFCSLRKGSEGVSKRIADIYIFEVIGSFCGGLIVSFFMLRFFSNVQIISCLILLNLWGVLFYPKKNKLIIFFLVSLVILSNLRFFSDFSLKKEWQGYNLLASRNSVYANNTVLEKDGMYSFFSNGLRLYSVPQEEAAEEAVHFALLMSPNLRKVLLVGGGVGGELREVLKYKDVQVDYVELDPLIIKLAEETLPKEHTLSLKDKRVKIINEDGRSFIKNSKEKYDCIILNIGSPLTAQLNRYYTVDFFKQVREILNDEGILSFGISASESYLNREQRDFLRSVYFSCRRVFNDLLVIPGETAQFLTCKSDWVLNYNYKQWLNKAESLGVNLKYVREYYLFSRLSPLKIGFINSVFEEKGKIKLNYDFSPVSYFYNMLFLATHFRDSLVLPIFRFFDAKKILAIIIMLCVLLIALGFVRFRSLSATIIPAVVFGGFITMFVQIMIILAFQVIYGFIYYKIGFLITFFMLGLFVGAFASKKINKNENKHYILTQFYLGSFCLLTTIYFYYLKNSSSVFVWLAGENIIFLFLSFIAGVLGGFEFNLAVKITTKESVDAARIGGSIYAADLIGACLGATIPGLFMLPAFGFIQSNLVIFALSIAVCFYLLRKLTD